MKKIITILTLAVVALGLGGCQKRNSNSESGQLNSGNIRSFENRRPDFGQPEREPDVRGLIKSIVSNEVTILKIERPDRGEGEGMGLERADGDEDSEERQAQPLLGTGTGGRMSGMGRGIRGGSMDDDVRAAMLEQIKEMSTGEIVVTIPVGIQMLKPGDIVENKQPEMLEATLTDIKQDKMITIWLDEAVTEKSVANFVLIMR